MHPEIDGQSGIVCKADLSKMGISGHKYVSWLDSVPGDMVRCRI